MLNRILLISNLLLLLSACDTGIKQMGPTEYGVIFRKLPPKLGGGMSRDVKYPGQMAIVWPWDAVYKFDTSVQDVTWGSSSAESDREKPNHESLMLSQSNAMSSAGGSNEASGYVHSRASDGNEVALAVTVRYQLSTEPEKLIRMVEQFVTTDQEVRDLVVSVARADIRTHMNHLRTAEFLDKEARYLAVDQIKKAMSAKLEKYGIYVSAVNLNDFRFERALPDGGVDTSYQDRLKEIQKLREDTEREKSRIETVQAKKSQELNEAQGIVNRQVAEADGAKNQAKFRGDAYFEARLNDSKAIRAQGEAEVKALIEKISALNGPGGHELLKLELAKQLLKEKPKFIVMNEGQSAQNIGVKRTDTNQLLSQLGLIEGMQQKTQAEEAPKQQVERSPILMEGDR